MRRWTTLVGMLLIGLMLASSAYAHVTVNPSQSTQGSFEVFTVRVPSEQEGFTTGVEVRIEEGVEISRVEPKPGWSYEMERDANGKVTSIVWSTEGEGLARTEFTEFRMQGRVGEEATTITWRAYQTYSDGSVAEWTGAEGSDKPASVTTVQPRPEGAETDSHGHVVGSTGGDAHTSDAEQAAPAASNWSTYLSAAALIIALAALVIVLARGRGSKD